jgi:ferric-dicitrate binding protein FerR (iron transport regulator)
MSPFGRKEAQVRALLEGPHPVVPAGLAAAAAAHGRRLLRRRRALRRFGWTLLCAAALAFTVWAALTRPWVTPPSQVSPPLEGW